MSPVPINHKQLEELPTSKDKPFLKVQFIHNLYDKYVRRVVRNVNIQKFIQKGRLTIIQNRVPATGNFKL